MQHHCFYPLHSCPLGALSRSGKPRVEPCLSALRQLKAVKPLFIPPSTVPPWGEPRPPPQKMFCLCCTKNPHTPASCCVRFWCVSLHGRICPHECFRIGRTLFYFGGACPLPPNPHVFQWSNLSLIPPPVPLGGSIPFSSFVFCHGCAWRWVALLHASCGSLRSIPLTIINHIYLRMSLIISNLGYY